jgi:hypothetical protein
MWLPGAPVSPRTRPQPRVALTGQTVRNYGKEARMARRLGVGVLVWLASTAGCGGGSVSSGNTNDGTSADACTQLVTMSCQRALECEPVLSQTLYTDVPSCVAALGSVCTATTALPGAGPMVADWGACEAAYRAASCDSLSSGNLPAACETQPGTLANGSPCAAGRQCQTSYCKIDYSASSDCGVCSGRSPVGGSCQVASGCEDGLVCAAASPTPTCVQPAAAGQNCDTTHPCQNDLRCMNGACAAPLGAGAACTSASDCDVRQGLWCTSGTCQLIKLADVGQSCDNAGSWCRAGGHCSIGSDAGAGSCVARKPNGAACEDSAECIFASECTNGACAAYQYPTCQ